MESLSLSEFLHHDYRAAAAERYDNAHYSEHMAQRNGNKCDIALRYPEAFGNVEPRNEHIAIAQKRALGLSGRAGGADYERRIAQLGHPRPNGLHALDKGLKHILTAYLPELHQRDGRISAAELFCLLRDTHNSHGGSRELYDVVYLRVLILGVERHKNDADSLHREHQLHRFAAIGERREQPVALF